ncbi:MAG: GntG family PLP-dependent aldolase [Candidatus Hydrogenedentes bacterium]|jgi:threonine aldolase|nr:GntG family PLP-dependent aldolase [Candidatus Hydrogenedentota bacterium]
MTSINNEMVDLRSDTLTKPTQAMREAMAAAEVGDDVFGEDPTVNELERRAADLLGKEAGLFVPSGTMANLLAFLAQSRPSDTLILNEEAHPFNYEGGNVAMVGGLLTRTISGSLGMMSADEIRPFVKRSSDHHFSQTTIVSIENTTNRGGGNMYSVEAIAEIRALADEYGMRLHCDGARLFNAVVASGISAADYVRDVDTACFCFSKGLGAPAGSILTGTHDVMEEAHRFRKLLGGGMRQAGILAAAGLHALDHHVDRLTDDHRRVQQFREALEFVPEISFPMATPTNIVYLDVPDAEIFQSETAAGGVRLLATGPGRFRAVFHLDVDDAGLEKAIDVCKRAAGRCGKG